jgi:hypothetical protein
MGGVTEHQRLATQPLRKFSHKYRAKIPIDFFNTAGNRKGKVTWSFFVTVRVTVSHVLPYRQDSDFELRSEV